MPTIQYDIVDMMMTPITVGSPHSIAVGTVAPACAVSWPGAVAA